ncbi:putative Aspartokinase [Seiridium cardinale]
MQDRKWIILKFGGTSIAQFPDKITEDIVRPAMASKRVLVVCSAANFTSQIVGVTSGLLEVFQLLKVATSGDALESGKNNSLDRITRIINGIRDAHISETRHHIQALHLREKVIADTLNDCRQLLEFSSAATRLRLEMNARCKDLVVSFGDRLSCRFMASMLQDRHIEAEFIDISEIMHQMDSEDMGRDLYRKLAIMFQQRILACHSGVPVVTGFFGQLPGGLIDGEIGRDYTDVCAALMAAGLEAEELQIWKDMDGIFSADPTKVPTARLRPSLSFSEAAELMFYGSKVIHPLAISYLAKTDSLTLIRVKNVNKPNEEGTTIRPDSSPPPAKRKTSSSAVPPATITIKDSVAVIRIHSQHGCTLHEFLARVFAVINTYGLSPDLVLFSKASVSMAVHTEACSSLQRLEAAAEELGKTGGVIITHGLAILSLVSDEIINVTGLDGRMFTLLNGNQVKMEMGAQRKCFRT